MITETGDHPFLGIGISGTHPKGTASDLPKETAVWWTTPQHHPDTHDRNQTREGYPVVFLLSSKSGASEGFVPIPSSGELRGGGQLQKRYSHGVGLQFSSWFSYVLRSEGFYSGRSENPAANLLKQVTQLQEDCRRHSWALDMDGCWFTRSSSAL